MEIIFSKKQTQDIIDLYMNERMSMYNIGRKYNISNSPIERILKTNNVKIRKRGETFIGVSKNYKTVGYEKGHKTWNKDLKGIHLSPTSEFKKGLVPWNKGMIFNPNRDFIKKLRSCEEGLKWRVAVYNKYKNICQLCGHSNKKNIVAHHIYRLKEIVDDNNITTMDDAYVCGILWDINNGVTLCRECHKVVHYGGGDAKK